MTAEVVVLKAWKQDKRRRALRDWERDQMRRGHRDLSDAELDRLVRQKRVKDQIEWAEWRLPDIPKAIDRVRADLARGTSSSGRTKGQPYSPSRIASLQSQERSLVRFLAETQRQLADLLEEQTTGVPCRWID